MFLVLKPKQTGADSAVLDLADAFHVHGTPDRTPTEQFQTARYMVETVKDFDIELHLTRRSALGL